MALLFAKTSSFFADGVEGNFCPRFGVVAPDRGVWRQWYVAKAFCHTCEAVIFPIDGGDWQQIFKAAEGRFVFSEWPVVAKVLLCYFKAGAVGSKAC